jgi:hypothetical protein
LKAKAAEAKRAFAEDPHIIVIDIQVMCPTEESDVATGTTEEPGQP